MFMPRSAFMSGALAILLATAAEAREFTDMTGRTVTVPDQVNTVITLGPVPVLNRFVEASGNGDRIVSGLPERFAKSGRWDMQYVFAPQIKDGPDLQDADYAPVIERILVLKPDVALTFDQATTDSLAANGVATVMLRVQTPDQAKDAVTLAELFAAPGARPRYAAFFDDTLAGISGKLASVPEDSRPRVLYISPKNMTQPHLIAEWWMKAGGARSVTDDGRTTETLSLTTETVVGADPDVIIVADPKDVAVLQEDANLSQLRAVKEGRILVTPVGAHIWCKRTSAQPLTVLWMATRLHPDLFPEAELRATVEGFYRDFFGAGLTDEQLSAILGS